ncbi:MAG: hypothetical protein IPM29_28265 [Planctomycetes bacterium]|nr:hypothetical protein [Planctomycetota bacterium]
MPDRLLSVASVALFAGLGVAQTNALPYGIAVGADPGWSSRYDPAGIPLESTSRCQGPAHWSPTGAYWFEFGPLQSPQRVGGRQLTMTGGFDFVSPFLGADTTDLAVDARGMAFVALANATVVEVGVNTGVLRSWNLAATPTAIALDEAGNLWLALAGSPLWTLQRLDPATGRSSFFTVPNTSGDIAQVLLDGRNAGSHVFVCGAGNAGVVEIDPATGVATRYAFSERPSAPADELELAPDGSVWALSRSAGIWRLDSATGSFVRFLDARVDTMGFDADGGLWIVEQGRLQRFDARSHELDVRRFVSAGGGAARMRDPAGVTLARVVAGGLDSDSDGVTNRDEAIAGTDPWDPLSTPSLDLTAFVDAPAGGELRVALRGNLALATLAFATSPARPGISIRGIGGALELLPAAILGFEPLLVPGSLELPIPGVVAMQGVWIQAVVFPIVGGVRFSDSTRIDLRPAVRFGISELFSNASNRDPVASGGQWASGALTPAVLGGRGLLGSFDHTVGRYAGNLGGLETFVFDTDGQDFPATRTLFGRAVRVTDGVFEFSDLRVPSGVRVVFRGSHPAVLRVAGDVRLDGELTVDGESVADGYDATAIANPLAGTWSPRVGQPGSRGGAGGGTGGAGATGCDGNGAQPIHFGSDGSAILSSLLSGYAGWPGRIATGGRGAPPFPADGRDASVVFGLFASITGNAAGGGSGGAFLSAGGDGMALRGFTGSPGDLGPPTPGGVEVPLLTAAFGVSSLDHYLVGGAGGGGGGSQPVNMTVQNITFENRPWHAGGGGAGGGGALALRIGDELAVAAGAALAARGGRGGQGLSYNVGPASPGGGGSGGSLLLQVTDPARVSQAGTLDVSGGVGGLLRNIQFNGLFVETVGGDGGHGFVRLEAPQGATLRTLGNVVGPATLPADSVGTLADRDDWSSARSIFYPTGSIFAPVWQSYTARVRVAGQTIDYSDDPARYNPANVPGLPIQLFVQGGRSDATGAIHPAGPWRTFVGGPAGLAQDDCNAVRFLILFDRQAAANVVVERVEIAFTR